MAPTRCKGTTTCRWLVGVSAAGTSTHSGAATRLLDQSEVCGGSDAKAQTPAGGWSECRRWRRARTVESASASHLGAAAHLLDQSELLRGGSNAKAKPPACGWPECQRRRRARTVEFRLRLAPCSSSKLVRSVGVGAWQLQCKGRNHLQVAGRSAGDRDEHALWSSSKLARSVSSDQSEMGDDCDAKAKPPAGFYM